MGVVNLKKILKKYLQSEEYKKIEINNIDFIKQHKDAVAYFDCTSSIIQSTIYYLNKQFSNKPKRFTFNEIDIKNDIINHINNICHWCAYELNYKILTTRCQDNILTIDYKFSNFLNPNLKFSIGSIKDLELNELESKKAIPMIPKNVNLEDVETIKPLVRCNFELFQHYSNADFEFVRLETFKDKLKEEDYEEIERIGLYRYIVLRYLKLQEIHKRRNKLSTFNINNKLYEAENFDEEFKKYLLKIPYTLIISIVPVVINYLMIHIRKNNINVNVQVLGCEVESEFVIKKHIETYYPNRKKIIVSNDSDFIQIFYDLDGYVKTNIESYLDILICPKSFWEWLFKGVPSYEDVLCFCLKLGTDYSKNKGKNFIFPKIGMSKNIVFTKRIKIIFEMYNQINYLENNYHEIKPMEINDEIIKIINRKLENMYFNYLLE